MSWSFPDFATVRLSAVRPSAWAAGAGLLCAVLAAPVHAGAEYYWQPNVSLMAETESNLDLDPGVHQWQEGYVASASTIFGIATPDSDTIIRPRINYRYYPDDQADDRLEGYLDFNSVYRTQRSIATLSGSLYRQDDLNNTFTSPLYNEISPGQPVTGSGQTTVGTAVDSLILYPKFVYDFTPLLGAGVDMEFQGARYSPADLSSHVNFNYYLAHSFVSWKVSPSTSISWGVLGSQYSAVQFTSRDTGTGATMGVETQWTPLLSTTGSLLYEHATFDEGVPDPFHANVNTWGATGGLVYKEEASQYRVNASRALSPTGGGALYNVDRVQFEYDRNLTARLSFTGAIIGLKTSALTSNIVASNRKYANALVEMHWFVTRTLFIQGGYQYAWQRYLSDLSDVGVGSAENNRIYLQFGYQGLGQQR